MLINTLTLPVLYRCSVPLNWTLFTAPWTSVAFNHVWNSQNEFLDKFLDNTAFSGRLSAGGNEVILHCGIATFLLSKSKENGDCFLAEN